METHNNHQLHLMKQSDHTSIKYAILNLDFTLINCLSFEINSGETQNYHYCEAYTWLIPHTWQSVSLIIYFYKFYVVWFGNLLILL